MIEWGGLAFPGIPVTYVRQSFYSGLVSVMVFSYGMSIYIYAYMMAATEEYAYIHIMAHVSYSLYYR